MNLYPIVLEARTPDGINSHWVTHDDRNLIERALVQALKAVTELQDHIAHGAPIPARTNEIAQWT